MHSAKEKLKDMGSEAKYKMKVSSIATQEKKEKATARNWQERNMADERAKAMKAQAKADLHQEKADHRAVSAAHHAGLHHVPLAGHHHHHAHAGTAAPATNAYSGAYPPAGNYY
ncbi:late embryogenesis abundant protein 18-like [Phalaenopsis equestris]|uniref:late embryogenesis abundant protein 18-like n=1 Tax=Phalaenopsis equestris TaxID=78828 RepID=UPI0009E3E324|nr:late embryogenesis abundant protein 18-like [Phalaenopsis equestris]